MKKRIIILLPLFLCLIDQMLKSFAKVHFINQASWGPFETGLIFNNGLFLGTTSSLVPAELRVILLASVGAFLVCLYAAFQYFLPAHILSIRLGLAVWLGGICGNLIDRLLQGSVLDFIEIKLGAFSTAVFNFADAVQWPGIALTIYGLAKYYDEIWPNYDSRKFRIVNKNFQITFVLIASFYCLGSALVSLAYSITFIKYIGTLFINSSILFSYTLGLLSLQGIYVMGVIFTSMLISNRIAGPIFSFLRHLQTLPQGKQKKRSSKDNFKLRKGDYFPELESTAKELSDRIKRKKRAS